MLKAQLMVGMVLSLFIALALATFVASLALQVRSGSPGDETQLNRMISSISSQISALRAGA